LLAASDELSAQQRMGGQGVASLVVLTNHSQQWLSQGGCDSQPAGCVELLRSSSSGGGISTDDVGVQRTEQRCKPQITHTTTHL
jgi:hypothetical protein